MILTEATKAKIRQHVARSERYGAAREKAITIVAMNSPYTIAEVREAVQQQPGCRQCGEAMNPAALMLGPVCGKCVRANHRAATA